MHACGRCKDLRVGKELGVQKVQQRPQLVQVVLQRRAGEQQLALGLDEFEALVEDGLLVLDAMAFVEYEIAPVHTVAEHRLHVL